MRLSWNSTVVIILAFLIATAIFFIDLVTPTSLEVCVGYLFVLLLVHHHLHRPGIIISTSLFTFFMVGGFLFSFHSSIQINAEDTILNRLLSVTLLWLSAMLILSQKKAYESLQDSEDRFRTAFNCSAIGIAHVGLEGRFLMVNQKLCEIIGYDRTDLLKLTIKEISFPEDLPDDEEKTERLLAGLIQTCTLEKRYIRKNGNIIWINQSVSLQRNRSGAPLHFISIFEDISERKQMEHELRESQHQLEIRVIQRTAELAKTVHVLNDEIIERTKTEAALRAETMERLRTVEELRERDRLLIQQSRLAALGEMIGNISHQWRQPLNILGLSVQRLSIFYGTASFNKEFVDETVCDAMKLIQNMSRVIDDFRDFFKPDTVKAPFSANQAISNAVSLVEAGFKSRKIVIHRALAQDFTIYGYQNEFSQAILNILMNARDAITERDVKEGCIYLESFDENGNMIVIVRDNAGGIAQDILDKIFDPYFTTKGPAQGTGLGLFMSKSIIENHMGGRLMAGNTIDGAEFRIEIGKTF